MNRRDIMKSVGAFGMVASVPAVTEPARIVVLPSAEAKEERKYMSDTAIQAVLTFFHTTMNDEDRSFSERMGAASLLSQLALDIDDRILLRETLVYTVKE